MQLKFLKFEKKWRKGGVLASPDFLWSMLQLLALIIILVSFAFGFYLFNEINKGLILNPEDLNHDQGIINEGRINKALEYFNGRASVSNQVINSPAPFVDPSR